MVKQITKVIEDKETLKKFFFPKENITIEASSQEEAIKLLLK